MNSSKLYANIDYTFRPTSYWAPPSDVLEAALRNVKGRNRREMIRVYYEDDRLEYLHPNLLFDSLDTKARQSLGRIHRSFMGGEYLPKYKRNEVDLTQGTYRVRGDLIDIFPAESERQALRVELFDDGRLQLADSIQEEGRTSLSLEPLPSPDHMRALPEFRVWEIEQSQFEQVWRRAQERGEGLA